MFLFSFSSSSESSASLRKMAMFLIFFLDVVKRVAGLDLSPFTTTVSPMNNETDLPLEPEA